MIAIALLTVLLSYTHSQMCWLCCKDALSTFPFKKAERFHIIVIVCIVRPCDFSMVVIGVVHVYIYVYTLSAYSQNFTGLLL